MAHRGERPIRWGILGTGRIAELFVQGLAVLPDAEVVAVASRAPETAEAFGERFGVPRRHGEYAALAADEEVDVVYVATPHSVHRDATLLCLDAGKAVLCEKPFALNAAEAREMIAAARRHGLFLMEAMWTRFAPAMVELRRLLADGVLGDVRLLTADLGWRFDPDPRHRLYDPQLGGGALLDLGVYPVSLASMVLGNPSAVSAVATLAETGVDAQTAVLLRHPGDRLAVLSCSMQAALPIHAAIVGSEARVEIRNWYNPGGFVLRRDGADPERFAFSRAGNGMEYEAAEVGRCLRAGALESAVMPLDETLTIMRTLDRVRAQIGLRYPGE
jgi:predicted dehydrogenase